MPTEEQHRLLSLLAEKGTIETTADWLRAYGNILLLECQHLGWVKIYHSNNDDWSTVSITDKGKQALEGLA